MIGYWLGTSATDSCDSSAITSALSDTKEWDQASRAFYWLQLHELGYVDSRFGGNVKTDMPLYGTQRQFAEDPINKCETDISKKLQRSVSHVQSGQQPSSDDYKAIVAFDKARDSLLNKPEYRAFANCISSLNTNCFDPRLCTLL